MAIRIGNLEVLMGPPKAGGPDDLKLALIDFINRARKSLDVAVQEIDDPAIATALIMAHKKGVRIRVILEGNYLSGSRSIKDPFIIGGRQEENRHIFNAFLRAKIDVKPDYNPGTFHQKFIIRDGRHLLTGSTNFTKSGLESNFNHLIIVKDQDIVDQYIIEFAEITKGKFGRESNFNWGPPKSYKVSGIPVKVLFAPDHAPEMELMKQMLKANKLIEFAIFTFAQSSGIDDTMRILCRSGIKIRGALDGLQANQRWAATHPIQEAGVELFTVSRNKAPGKLHHKLMVIDRQLVIAGSFNYTGPANYINDENIILIGDLEEKKQASKARQINLGKFASAEIERIITQYGQAI